MTYVDDELPAAFREWLREVDQIMKRDWYIDTEDAGTEMEHLVAHWRDGEAPEGYVAWFADKYGLIAFP